jgi:hypothetical protein
LENSVRFYNALRYEGFSEFATVFQRSFQGMKAPLISLLPVPLYFVFGVSYDVAMICNLLMIVALNIFLFLLVKERFSERHRLLAVAVTSTMPMFWTLSHQFLVGYGLTLLVITWFYLLVKSDCYRSNKYDVLLGVNLGLGLLMKVSFPLYVFVPSLLVLINRIRKDPPTGLARALLDVAIIIVIGLGIASTWYVSNFGAVMDCALSSGFGKLGSDFGMGKVFSLHTILSYWKQVVVQGISFWYALLMMLTLVAWSVRRLLTRRRLHIDLDGLVFGSWFIVPFIVMTFAVNKQVRFLAPSLPVVGVLFAFLLFDTFELRRRGELWLALVLLIPILTIAYSIVPIQVVNVDLEYGGLAIVRDKSKENPAFGDLPRDESWPIEDILGYLYHDASGTRTTLVMGVDHPLFNINNFSYYKVIHRYPIAVSTIAYLPKDVGLDSLCATINESEYLIIKTGAQGPSFLNCSNERIRDALLDGKLAFRPLKTFGLPDDSVAELWKRSNEP